MYNHQYKRPQKYGVPHEDIFQTVDLFEARNVSQVLKSLFALARTVRSTVTDIDIR